MISPVPGNDATMETPRSSIETARSSGRVDPRLDVAKGGSGKLQVISPVDVPPTPLDEGGIEVELDDSNVYSQSSTDRGWCEASSSSRLPIELSSEVPSEVGKSRVSK